MTGGYPGADPATMPCGHCQSIVPAGEFCGDCGAYLTPRPGGGPAWFRAGSFCPAPRESVLWPHLASTLLPQLAELTRRTFGAALVVMVIAMAVLVELGIPGGLITVASLGLPVLLFGYWRKTGALAGIPRRVLATTVILALGLAFGWVWLAGDLIDRVSTSPFEAGSVGRRVLRDGLGVAEGGAFLMLLPAIVVRLVLRQSRREVLDGFVIGILGALSFTAAATLARLAPQFVSAPITRNQPVDWLLFEATVRGVTVPLTAACAGGLVGIALWFSRRQTTGRVNSRAAVAILVLFAVAVLSVYCAVGWADGEGASQFVVLSWHAAMAVIAVVLLRVGLQLALLHGHSALVGDAELRCSYCGHRTPEMAFCPACGVATGIASARACSEQGNSRPAFVSIVVTWLATMTVLSAVFVGLPMLMVNPLPRYNCPPDCGRPPSGVPVSTNPRLTAMGGQFSVAYPGPGSAYDVSTDDTGVTARFTAGDGGDMRLTGEPAAGRTAKDVAKAFLAAKFPTARMAYQIPNAKLGFHPAYGEVADVFPLNLDESFKRTRVVIVVGVKDDFALIAAGAGPYREFGPTVGPGRPSAANVQIAEDMGRYINSFMWRGDPPR